jgi:hypothetical protein
MANTQISIVENGKKTLKTAGKYCDRDIEVNVNVPSSGVQPTQFTNLLTQEDTVITYNVKTSSTAGETTTANGYVLVEVHLKNFVSVSASNADVFRFRGVNLYNGQVHCSVDGGKTWVLKYISAMNNYNPDEYGDAMIRVTYGTDVNGVEDIILRFNLGLGGGGIANTAITNLDVSKCIMTRNEPIGNGGYVGS